MRVYSIWDYMDIVFSVIHLMGLIALLGGMVYLFFKELKKFN